jgi:hypothetical protein
MNMAALSLTIPTLAVSVTYCLWHAYRMAYLRRDRRMRERVAYMLWTMADQVG